VHLALPINSILWTCLQYALLDPTPSSVHLCALRAPPAPSTLSSANPHAAAAAPARLPTCPVSRSASRALTPAPVSSPAPLSPTATVLTPQSATRTAALLDATLPTAALCANEHLWALTLRAVAPTAALQPTFSTSAPEAHRHPKSVPTATAHARRVLPAASAPMQARAVPSRAQQALSLPLSVQQPAIPAPQARTPQVPVRRHAAAAPPERTVLQAHRSSAAAPSTRMRPLLVVPAPARPVLGKLYPARGRASA
jgi:hypothetical protein